MSAPDFDEQKQIMDLLEDEGETAAAKKAQKTLNQTKLRQDMQNHDLHSQASGIG